MKCISTIESIVIKLLLTSIRGCRISSPARACPRRANLIVSFSRFPLSFQRARVDLACYCDVLAADLDVPVQYLETQTVYASVDEAPDVDEAVVDERHASDEDEVARDEKQTSQQQVDQALDQAEHRQQRRHQPVPRQQTELEKGPQMCGCKGWGGLCRCHHA
jgi:hypothetical protein